jgi:uncharacterized protein YndB with AHSA1/START domain
VAFPGPVVPWMGRNERDGEIVVRRMVDAPRRHVFAAWTEARHVARWFGPTGFSVTTSSFEFRVGGVWDFVMHGPTEELAEAMRTVGG